VLVVSVLPPPPPEPLGLVPELARAPQEPAWALVLLLG